MNTRIRRSPFLCLCTTLLLSAPIPAQVQWRRLPQVTPSIVASVAVFDASRSRVVVFGGFDTTTTLDKTFEWDGSQWFERFPAQRPAARANHGLAYDAERQRVVVFGGWDMVATDFGDTWEWDGSVWTRVATSGPVARTSGAMTYDAARQRTVLFGGADANSMYGDTWDWDGTNWTQRTPAVSPSARAGHAVAYDAARRAIVLFGGFSAAGVIGETWEWDGSNWTQRSPAVSPPARVAFSMTYDSARRRTVLFGGFDANFVALADTWEWDGSTWHARSPAASPSARNDMALAYDSARRQVVGVGGFDTGVTSEIWVLEPTQPAKLSSYGAGCASSAGVAVLAGVDGSLPWLDQILSMRVSGLPTGPGHTVALFVGVSDRSFGGRTLPLDLGPLGMTGCQLLTSIELALPLTPAQGEASVDLPIPDDASMLGSMFFMQAAATDAAANPLGVALSNGAAATVGAL